jgi:hypothetical protein
MIDLLLAGLAQAPRRCWGGLCVRDEPGMLPPGSYEPAGSLDLFQHGWVLLSEDALWAATAAQPDHDAAAATEMRQLPPFRHEPELCLACGVGPVDPDV